MRDWTEFWFGYRKKTGDLTWRLARPADIPGIRKLRNVTERFLGKPQRDVSLFEKPVLLALVAENERGIIVDCLYVEAQVEVVKIAASRKGMEEAAELEQDVEEWLRHVGYRTVWATTMPRLKNAMAGTFQKLGFKCLDTVMSVWRRRL